MKTRQDNYVIDHINAVYAENKIEQLWQIRPCLIYDVNQIRQQCDRSYGSSLHQNQN